MRRTLVMLLLAFAAPQAAAEPSRAPTPAVAVPAESQGAWRAACRHYENRARFRSRNGDVEFPTVLADGCAAALGPALSADAEGDAARSFLDSVASARRVVDAMNAARIRAATERAEPGFSRQVRDLGRSMRLVSETGEYLILRSEGVFAALDAWVASGGRFALAAALP